MRGHSVLPVLSTLCLVSAGVATPQAPAVPTPISPPLEWQLRPGESFYLVNTIVSKERVRHGDEVRELTSELREIARFTVEEADADEGTVLAYTILHYEEPGDLAVPLRGARLEVRLSADGGVSFGGFAEMLDEMDDDLEVRRSFISRQLSREALRQKVAELFAAAPGRAPAAGETWRRESVRWLPRFWAGAGVRQTFRYAGPAPETGLEEIRLSLEGSEPVGGEPRARIGGLLEARAAASEDESWLHFDPRRGRVVEMRDVTTLRLRFAAPEGTTLPETQVEAVLTRRARILDDPLGSPGGPVPSAWDPDRDPQRLAIFFARDCEAGDARSCLDRAGLYPEESPGVPSADAIVPLRRSADLGLAEAQRLLGLLLLQGRGVVRNEPEARRYLGLAAAQGDPRAQSRLRELDARAERLASENQERLAQLRGAAEAGQPRAGLLLAEIYERVGYDQRAAEELRKAAEAGLPAAQRALARAYASGLGAPRDQAEANRWYRRAAEAGDPDAQHELALRLVTGEGASRPDPEASVTWLRQASASKHAEARIELGYALQAGRGVPRDDLEATRCLRRPLGPAHWATSLSHAANRFEKGLDRPTDRAWAALLLEVADEEGDDPRYSRRLDALKRALKPEEQARYDDLRSTRGRDAAWNDAVREAWRASREFPPTRALDHGRAALGHAERVRGGVHLDVAEALEFLAGFTRAREGRSSMLDRALSIREELLGPDHVTLVPVLTARARGAAPAAAETLLRRALAIAERAYGQGAPEVGDVLEALYPCTRGEQRVALAERELSIRELNDAPHRVWRARFRLAAAHDALGHYEPADALYRRLLAEVEDADDLRIEILVAMASSYLERPQLDEVRLLLKDLEAALRAAESLHVLMGSRKVVALAARLQELGDVEAAAALLAATCEIANQGCQSQAH